MTRILALCGLLAAGAAAHPGLRAEDRAAMAPLPSGAVAFKVVPEAQALSQLSAKAEATPGIAKFMPGVPLSQDSNGKVHDIKPTETPNMTPPTPASTNHAHAQVAAASCASPTKVYEWRNAAASSQQAFSSAIACLHKTAARSGLAGTVTRWDDLAAIHQQLTPQIHSDGVFLPWHRYFLYIFEQELRNTCSYTGPMLWWDETKDAGHFNAAPMYTASYFGSMPDGSAQCITNGQFSSYALHIGPGSGNSNHCLARGCSESTSSQITASYVNQCWSYTDFNQMQQCVDYGVHALGHNAIGGNVMNDVYASPQDPAFFIHHGFVNRIWSYWQRLNANNANSLDGYTTSACESGSQTSGCSTMTTSYILSSLNFYPSTTVGAVMSTTGGSLCYVYDY